MDLVNTTRHREIDVDLPVVVLGARNLPIETAEVERAGGVRSVLRRPHRLPRHPAEAERVEERDDDRGNQTELGNLH